MSSEDLIFIPGLEILTKEGYEILGIGIRKFLHKSSLEETIKFIHKNNGTAILAHPCKYKKLPKSLDVDGIEILNFEYDGFFPCPRSLKLLKELREKNKNVFGIFGLDIHRKIHFRNIFVEMKCKMNEKKLIQNFKKGYFQNKNSFFSLSPQNNLNKISKIFCFSGYKVFSCLKGTGKVIFKILRKIKIIK